MLRVKSVETFYPGKPGSRNLESGVSSIFEQADLLKVWLFEISESGVSSIFEHVDLC